MADVNEEIIEQYLKIVKKWFCVVDIPFKVPQNYSNIDILAYDPKIDKYYDIEVKFRSAYSVTNNGKDIIWLVEQFSKYKNAREKKLKEYTGRKKAEKILITTRIVMGKSSKKRIGMESDFKKYMKDEGYKSHVWYFDDLIPKLVESVDTTGRYNTQLLQTIRMLKVYSS